MWTSFIKYIFYSCKLLNSKLIPGPVQDSSCLRNYILGKCINYTLITNMYLFCVASQSETFIWHLCYTKPVFFPQAS